MKNFIREGKWAKMNRIDELIREYCPDGVEIRYLEDCCNLLDKKRKPITKAFREAGEYPYYGANGIQDYVANYIFDGTYVLVGEDGSVITKEGTPVVTWAKGKIWVNNHAHIIEEKEGVMLRYLYHYLQTIDVTSLIHGNIPKLTGGDFKALKIAVPPLEVQREIVRVLDSFTLLTAELTAELTARKKQYNFYRDKLLTFGKDTLNCRLKEICDICLGLTATPNYTDAGVKFISAQNTSNDFLDLSNVKYISEADFEKATSNAKPQKGDLLFTRVGSNLGHPVVVETDEDLCIFVSLGFLRIRNKEQVIIGYLKHWMNTDLFWSQVRKNVHGAAKVNLNTGWLKEFNISLPPLETQERIVHVLDNFESICTDLNIGLPAEIEARQKQYEYYRDLLLTFAEKGNTIMTDRQTDRQTELSAIKLIQYVFGYVMLPLGKVANIFRGEYITKKNTKAGSIPVILGGQEPAYYIDKHNHDGEIVVVARSGASAGFVSYWNQKIFVTDGFGYEEKSELITTKFLYYVLKNMESELNAMKRGAGVPHISGEMLNSIELPIPLLQEQNRITDILDRFDTLCNDLSTGLPAEIEARQKQYEYYKDKLLSFKELPK